MNDIKPRIKYNAPPKHKLNLMNCIKQTQQQQQHKKETRN